jgi:hypothetical protein
LRGRRERRGWVEWLKPVILATQEVDNRRISSAKHLRAPHLNQWVGLMAHAVTPAMQGSTSRKTVVSANSVIKQDLISKITNKKRAGGAKTNQNKQKTRRASLPISLLHTMPFLLAFKSNSLVKSYPTRQS